MGSGGEGAGSGDRGSGKRGSSTPCPPPHSRFASSANVFAILSLSLSDYG